ncbi:MAG: AI-2E family transporter [Thermoguttaceae bacterium]|nr:AI-2E family transporter [Thermoguttaceae bacterium]
MNEADKTNVDRPSKGSAKSPKAPGAKKERKGELINYAALLASGIVVLAGIHSARGVLGIFFLATFFTVLLITPVNWLKSKGVASWLALTVVIIGVAAIGLSAMTVVGAQLAQFAGNIDNYRYKFTEKFKEYNLNLEEFFPSLKSSNPDQEEEEEPLTSAKDVETAYLDELRAGARLGRAQVDALRGYRDETTVESAGEDRGEAREGTGSGSPPAAERAPGEATMKNVGYSTKSVEDAPREIEPKGATSGFDGMASSWNDELPRDGLAPNNPRAFLEEDGDSLVDDPSSGFVGGLNPYEERSDAERGDGGLLDDYATAGRLSDQAYEDYRRADERAETSAVGASSQQIFRFLKGLAGELSALFSNALLITLLVIFMLCETAKIPKKLVAALGKRRFTNSHIEGVVHDIRNYMVIKTTMSCAVGALVVVLCALARIQYPLLWGFVAFILNYIPNIGSVAAAVPPIVLATVDHGVGVGCAVAVGFAVINCGIGYVLEPRLLGDGLDLSPLIVLIALIFFGWLLGPVGMFLSPPLAVVMKIIFQSFPETRWIAALMANRPPPPIKDDDSVPA